MPGVACRPPTPRGPCAPGLPRVPCRTTQKTPPQVGRAFPVRSAAACSHPCASRGARAGRGAGHAPTQPQSPRASREGPPSAGPPPCHRRPGSLCVRPERRGRAIGPPARGASPFLARLMHMHERPGPPRAGPSRPLPRGRARRAARRPPRGSRSPSPSPSPSQGEPSLLRAGGGGAAPAMSARASRGPP